MTAGVECVLKIVVVWGGVRHEYLRELRMPAPPIPSMTITFEDNEEFRVERVTYYAASGVYEAEQTWTLEGHWPRVNADEYLNHLDERLRNMGWAHGRFGFEP